MNYRQAELLATVDITTDGTKVIDINVKDVISRLGIVLELINDGIVPTNHPVAAIKRIEVIDGSEVIASLTGYAAQALAYYNSGKMPHNELNWEDNAYMRAFIPLDFGRFLFDEELGLDPMKFRNLQLRIEHEHGLGGCSPDGAYLRVIADMFDEKAPSPVGFLLNKEVTSFMPVTGSAKYIELPLDNAIRKLLIMNTNDDEEPDVQFENVKIDEEDGKRIVIDCLTMDLIRAASMKFGMFSEYFSGRFNAATTAEFFLTACKDIQISAMSNTSGVVVHFTWTGGRGRTVGVSGAAEFGGIVSGRCPHGAVPIFLGKQEDMGDWWDVTNLGKARVTLTPRADPIIDDEKNTDVILQSLHRY